MIYNVWVRFEGGAYYTVEANSDEEAQELAMEKANIEDCIDWGYDPIVDIENN